MASLRSGQITVTTAGAAVTYSGSAGRGTFYIKPHPDNTDTVWVGNDGADDVTSSNGLPLTQDSEVIIYEGDLSDLYFDADVDGEKFCWFKAIP